MNIATINLARLRHNYAICRRRLALRNTKKLPVGVVMATMNVVRGKLIREIQLISWQLWPETGRPSVKCKHHMIDAPVYQSFNGIDTWLSCNINEDNTVNGTSLRDRSW
jgi:hypothetical protein